MKANQMLRRVPPKCRAATTLSVQGRDAGVFYPNCLIPSTPPRVHVQAKKYLLEDPPNGRATKHQQYFLGSSSVTKEEHVSCLLLRERQSSRLYVRLYGPTLPVVASLKVCRSGRETIGIYHPQTPLYAPLDVNQREMGVFSGAPR